MTDHKPEFPTETDVLDAEDAAGLACVLSFNANDPSGAGGLSCDATAMASVGAHCMPVCTGAYVRDTSSITDFYPLDEEAVHDQARAVAEDVPVQVIKVGFVGTPESLAVIAELSDDYDGVPVVAYMPNLSWWEDDKIDAYQDAFRELVLPQTSVLVGHHSTLRRWLLPEWSGERNPGPRDIAKAAAELGVPYTLVTGLPLPDQHIDNALASPETVLAHEKFERIEAVFAGAGDTLTAALAALLATGMDLPEATSEALHYLDRCLDEGFRPGMGQVIPDRLFWALPEGEETDGEEGPEVHPGADYFEVPFNETKH
ncbi:bifunctional hydroxymethylpyrimidine kinase/phosphomethylpyrimidine kinase [Limnohabitans sp. Hippo3]|uniref:bifunctional hydroxymethylpyrimidine kinase/phosphomethylpyrimidine kinase n=1 Tax=Limnohabitans sp. Hippo3 TaxID=1597956 RepID=UPI000D3CFDE0|nr:bifunctional hydroxymethylpyrimidine kinase/phosphomethylpyrimidine kinase [Limnohabitans sp. Hippo3]PUE42115.1 hydroxymethylpyrimidine/phosphomethylpyrimidine kinase [Limnohabitans sp. Hippo3]